MSGLEVRLETVNGPEALDQLRAALDTFWTQHDEVPGAVRIQVGIAAAEVAANIIEHGDATWLCARIHAGLTQMHVNFTDDGTAATVNLGAVVMPDALAERGRGLALAKAALGLFTYHHDQFGNHWRLISRAFGRISDASLT